MPGVQSCTLNFTTASLKVGGDISKETVIDRIHELGYEVGAPTEAAAVNQRGGPFAFIRFLLQRRDTTLALIGFVLILPGLIVNELLGLEARIPLLDVTSVLAMLVAGWPIARSAWRGIRINHEITMNLLMVLAGIGAVLIGAYTEAGVVVVLFSIGEALEGYTMEKARRSIRSLLQVAPNEAIAMRPCIDCKEHLGQDGYTGGPCPFCGLEEQRIPVADLHIGDILIVHPGERIPMDGRIRSGSSAVNQAPITGESVAVEKHPGDNILAGCINGQGTLEVEVTHTAADNAIARIIRMVEETQERRAPTQRFVDQFAKYYTPAVVVFAALVAVIPPLFLGAPFLNPDAHTQGWLYRALELLVVACPCALVISTPVSIVSAISNAAHSGVLIKGGAYLEALSRVKAIAFDKTGTLTEGQPSVVITRSVDCENLITGSCDPCSDLLALASAVERRSEHPLARAVVNASEERTLNHRYPSAENVSALTGQGVSGVVNGHSVVIGSHTYFEENVPHLPAHCTEITELSRQGQTPMMVSSDGQYLGYITLSDGIRPTTPNALQQLKQLGIQTLVMLTGDNEGTAQRIGAQAGVTGVRAELLPEDKLKAVEELRQQYGSVAMVGDGVNDAPALAAANVGIAMGNGGTAQALETADIALMSGDLSRLPYAFRLSQAAMRTIRQNVIFSLAIKAIFFVIVLLGFGAMWMAVLADMGASLLVTFNGMRLLHKKIG